MEPVAGLEPRSRFSYEENAVFPSQTQEQFANIRRYFSVFSPAFTDSFTDSESTVEGLYFASANNAFTIF